LSYNTLEEKQLKNFQIYEIILKVCKILRKTKIDYGRIFNPLQNWNLISLKFKIFTWNIGKIKNIIKILVNSSKHEVKILIFKRIKSHFCKGLKIQP